MSEGTAEKDVSMGAPQVVEEGSGASTSASAPVEEATSSTSGKVTTPVERDDSSSSATGESTSRKRKAEDSGRSGEPSTSATGPATPQTKTQADYMKTVHEQLAKVEGAVLESKKDTSPAILPPVKLLPPLEAAPLQPDGLERIDPAILALLTPAQVDALRLERYKRTNRKEFLRAVATTKKQQSLREAMLEVDQALFDVGAVELGDYVERWKRHYGYDHAGGFVKVLDNRGNPLPAETDWDGQKMWVDKRPLRDFSRNLKEDVRAQQNKIRKLEEKEEEQALRKVMTLAGVEPAAEEPKPSPGPPPVPPHLANAAASAARMGLYGRPEGANSTEALHNEEGEIPEEGAASTSRLKTFADGNGSKDQAMLPPPVPPPRSGAVSPAGSVAGSVTGATPRDSPRGVSIVNLRDMQSAEDQDMASSLSSLTQPKTKKRKIKVFQLTDTKSWVAQLNEFLALYFLAQGRPSDPAEWDQKSFQLPDTKGPEGLRHTVTCKVDGQIHAVRNDPGQKTVRLAREALAKRILTDFYSLKVGEPVTFV